MVIATAAGAPRLVGEVDAGVPDVAVDSHLGNVEACELDLGRNAVTAHQAANHHERDACHHAHISDVGANTAQSSEELPAVAVEQALHRPRDAIEPFTVSAVSEQSQGDNAPRAVAAVHRNSADRVVDAERGFDEEGCGDHQEAADGTDEQRNARADEGAGRRDGDQARQQASVSTSSRTEVTVNAEASAPMLAQVRAAVRIDQSGNVVSSKGDASELSQVAAYAARLAELVGDGLGMQGLVSVEVTQQRSRTLIYKEKSGNTFALSAAPDADLTQVRERLGL